MTRIKTTEAEGHDHPLPPGAIYLGEGQMPGLPWIYVVHSIDYLPYESWAATWVRLDLLPEVQGTGKRKWMGFFPTKCGAWTQTDWPFLLQDQGLAAILHTNVRPPHLPADARAMLTRLKTEEGKLRARLRARGTRKAQ